MYQTDTRSSSFNRGYQRPSPQKAPQADFSNEVGQLIQSVAFYENNIEVARTSLCRLEVFDLHHAFDLIDNKKTGRITREYLMSFLDISSQQAEFLITFQKRQVLDGLHYEQFGQMVLPRNSMMLTNQLSRISRKITAEEKNKLEKALIAFLHRELDFCADFDQRRKALKEKFWRICSQARL